VDEVGPQLGFHQHEEVWLDSGYHPVHERGEVKGEIEKARCMGNGISRTNLPGLGPGGHDQGSVGDELVHDLEDRSQGHHFSYGYRMKPHARPRQELRVEISRKESQFAAQRVSILAPKQDARRVIDCHEGSSHGMEDDVVEQAIHKIYRDEAQLRAARRASIGGASLAL